VRDELQQIEAAIRAKELPASFDQLFGKSWDESTGRFNVQETYVLDFKEHIPEDFTSSYGAGIVRLALAFYNSYGGIIVFGVRDRELSVVGVNRIFDIEKLNRLLTDVSGINVELLIRSYQVPLNDVKTIVALLIPKRRMVRPVKLIRDFAYYKKETLWVRDRHEALEAGPRFLPILYSERLNVPDSPAGDDGAVFPVHRSLPPSPATLKDFINRGTMMELLWDWFVFGDQPRFYLHGPGGSGKSTLAFEFAKTLAEYGHSVRAGNGDRLDYVIYLSGKETEFNPQTGQQQGFALRQFSNACEQCAQILFHSGFINATELVKNDKELNDLLAELFANFSGLIVVDDIDALSRRKVDTGEESLFIKAVQAPKRTRILYTLRFAPAHAVASAKHVPGLEASIELPNFVNACCKQFNVAFPTGEELIDLRRLTDSLPLLVETIILLRRSSGSYKEALRTFTDKGGGEARRYLYQREYDGLHQQGKARQLLAALFLLSEPTSVPTLRGLFQFSPEHVTDAISESSSVFLSAQENDAGETLYQLTPPCVPFVETVSRSLPYFGALERRVEHFKTLGAQVSAREAILITSMERLIRQRSFERISGMYEMIPPLDLARENPKIRSLVGQAFAQMDGKYRETARECFKHAEGLGFRDVYMMRSWFYLEFTSGYGLAEAERICEAVIHDPKYGQKIKSEFWSKFGNCMFTRAGGVLGANREKGIEFLRRSIIAYLEAIWVGKNLKDMDIADTFSWLDKPLQLFTLVLRGDIEQFCALFEALADTRHDVDVDATEKILDYLDKFPAPSEASAKARFRGLCMRSVGKVYRVMRPVSNYPGFSKIVEALQTLARHFDPER
jgi:ribosomal protein S8